MAHTASAAAPAAPYHYRPTPVGWEARGKWRVFRRQLAAEYDRIDRAAYGPVLKGPLIEAYLYRSAKVGRQRALNKLIAALRPAVLEWAAPQYVCFSYLKARDRMVLPTEPTNDPGLGQDAVCVHYLLLGNLPQRPLGMSIADGTWTLEIPDHAGGRLLERDRKAQPGAVIRAAHRHLLRLSCKAMLPHIVDYRRSFLLPAGRGWFLCQALYGPDAQTGDNQLHIRARSWLSEEMAVDNYPELPVGDPGDQVGEGWLRPIPLRT